MMRAPIGEEWWSDDGTARRRHRGRGARPARDRLRVHPLRRTHLPDPRGRQAPRDPDRGRAPRGERGLRGRRRLAHDRDPRRRRGHGRARRHEHAHRGQERADGADAAPDLRRRDGDAPQGTRLAAGHRSDLADPIGGEVGHHREHGAGARADGEQGARDRAGGRAGSGLRRGAGRPPLPGVGGPRLVHVRERRRERDRDRHEGARALPQGSPLQAIPPAAHRRRRAAGPAPEGHRRRRADRQDRRGRAARGATGARDRQPDDGELPRRSLHRVGRRAPRDADLARRRRARAARPREPGPVPPQARPLAQGIGPRHRLRLPLRLPAEVRPQHRRQDDARVREPERDGAPQEPPARLRGADPPRRLPARPRRRGRADRGSLGRLVRRRPRARGRSRRGDRGDGAPRRRPRRSGPTSSCASRRSSPTTR